MQELFASQASLQSAVDNSGSQSSESPDLLYLRGLLHWKENARDKVKKKDEGAHLSSLKQVGLEHYYVVGAVAA